MADRDKKKSGTGFRRVGRFFIHRLPVLAPLLILVGALLFNAFDSPFIAQLRNFTFDTLQRLKPREYDPQLPVRIIDIDEASLAKYGQWPWPRTFMAQLFQRLTDAGAAAIAFDGILAEPDRTSPLRLLSGPAAAEVTPELRALLQSMPDNDAVLVNVLSHSPVVLGYAMRQKPGGRAPVRKAGVSFQGDNPARYLESFAGTVTNLPEFEKAAAGVGSITTSFQGDNVVRGVPMFFNFKGNLYPALFSEALRTAIHASTYVIKSSGASGEESFGAQSGLINVRLVSDVRDKDGNPVIGYVIPTDSQGRVLLYDTGPKPQRFISVADVMRPDFDTRRIEDSILFLGSTAEGLRDIRQTPLDPVAPGVAVHAQLIEQVLTGTYLQRPDWMSGVEIIYLAAIGLFMVVLLPRLRAAYSGLAAVVFVGTALAISWFGFSKLGWLIDPVYPSVSLVLIFASGTLFSYIRSEAERRRVRNAFSLYLAPDLVKEVAGDPERLRLGGEQREVTVMFTDIRSFTTLSEGLKPPELTRLLNGFLTPMTDIILGRRGTIDKYMGDAIMAFWNAPLDDADHAANACRAALEMRARLVELNKTWRELPEEERLPTINIGIGLNSGDASVGNFGSDRRFAYSIIGDSVNLASRLEGQTKSYGVDTLISEETYRRAPGFRVLELDLVRVKGKQEPARIYALLATPETAEDEPHKALREAQAAFLLAYRAGEFEAAQGLLEAAQRAAEVAGWVQHYYDVMAPRVAELCRNPPQKWDGVYEALTK